MIKKKLEDLTDSANIAEMLTTEERNEIAVEAKRGFELDKKSMSEWFDDANKIMKLIRLKSGHKTTPWEGAADIQYPLIMTAVLQSASATLPEVVRDNKVVQPKVIGKDPDDIKFRKGMRVAQYMNYKLLDESDTWVEETDKVVHQATTIGTVIKKSYYNPVTRTINSRLVPYNEIVINNNIKSLEEAPRITHITNMSINELITGQRQGYYSEFKQNDKKDNRKVNEAALKSLQDEAEGEDENFNPEFLEQHTYIDLDGDGYKEPYTVLFHPHTLQIIRIRANYTMEDVAFNTKNQVINIKPQTFFSDFHHIHHPDGSFWSLGLGTLLMSTNETVNSLYNQLVDSGTLANHQGGFISKEVRMDKDDIRMGLGEWVQAEAAMGTSLKDGIVPLQYKEPSQVLFALLTFLIESSKALSSSTDAMTGTADTQNTSPTTLLTLIQQGMKVFKMTQKRIFRGLKKEQKMLYKMYALHTSLDEYLEVLDLSDEEIAEATGNTFDEIKDFDFRSLDIIPVANFNTSSVSERMLQNKALLEVLATAGSILNAPEILRRYFVGMEVDEVDKLFAPQQQGPTPEQVKTAAEIDIKTQDLKLKEMQLQIDSLKAVASVKKDMSAAIKNIADAEAAEAGVQLGQYQHVVDNLTRAAELELSNEKLQHEKQQNETRQNPNGATDPMA